MSSSRTGVFQTITPVAVAATSVVQVLTEEKNRDYVMIQNNGADDVLITFEVADTLGFVLKPDSIYEPRLAPKNTVFIRNDSGSVVNIIIAED